MSKARLVIVILTTALALFLFQHVTLSSESSIRRIAGEDRYATSALVSQAKYPDGADTVYIASGETLVDAMVVGAVADGPVLLVKHDEIPEPVRVELKRLAPTQVIILGGNDVVSDDIERQLGGGSREPAAYSSYLLDKINGERSPPVVMASDLNAVAYDWSEQMAASRQMSHNPDYPYNVCCWQRAAENVGWRTLSSMDGIYVALDKIHEGFMVSQPHRDNILYGGFDDVGIGVVVSDRCPDNLQHPYCVWVTQDFRERA